MLLTVAYVIRIGGDFMYVTVSHRAFLCEPADAGSRRATLSWPHAGLAAAAILGVALSAPYQPSLLADAHFGARDPAIKNLEIRGIHDERRWYYPQTGLLRQEPGSIHPNHPWAYDGLNFRAQNDRLVVRANIGFLGYFAGPRVHIIDPFALADPLLARLPAVPNSRIGHFRRELPAGYAESVLGAVPSRIHPSAELSPAASVITGPLFTRARVRRLSNWVEPIAMARTRGTPCIRPAMVCLGC